MALQTVDLRAEAAEEVRRLERARAMSRDGDVQALARLEGDAAWVARPRRGRRRHALRGRVCLVWRAGFEDASGRLAESRLVPLLIDARCDVLDPAVRERVETECEAWAAEVERIATAFTAARLARARGIAARQSAIVTAFQSGLFDRRAERTSQTRAAEAARSEQAVLDRLRSIEAAGASARVPARLLLALVP